MHSKKSSKKNRKKAKNSKALSALEERKKQLAKNKESNKEEHKCQIIEKHKNCSVIFTANKENKNKNEESENQKEKSENLTTKTKFSKKHMDCCKLMNDDFELTTAKSNENEKSSKKEESSRKTKKKRSKRRNDESGHRSRKSSNSRKNKKNKNSSKKNKKTYKSKFWFDRKKREKNSKKKCDVENDRNHNREKSRVPEERNGSRNIQKDSSRKSRKINEEISQGNTGKTDNKKSSLTTNEEKVSQIVKVDNNGQAFTLDETPKSSTAETTELPVTINKVKYSDKHFLEEKTDREDSSKEPLNKGPDENMENEKKEENTQIKILSKEEINKKNKKGSIENAERKSVSDSNSCSKLENQEDVTAMKKDGQNVDLGQMKLELPSVSQKSSDVAEKLESTVSVNNNQETQKVEDTPIDQTTKKVEAQKAKNCKEGEAVLQIFCDNLFKKVTKFPKLNCTLASKFTRKILTIDQSRLVGQFYNEGDNGEWRIIGMRPTRTSLVTIEYDIMRLCKTIVGINCDPFLEVMTKEKNNHILKLCNSDNIKDHLFFIQPYKLLQKLSITYQNFRQRRHFPAVFGCGAFEELCYKERISLTDLMPKLLIIFPCPTPRPYFIQEKVLPTLEDLFRMTQFGVLNVGTARDVIIGCIKALRLIHRVGYVHRCVAPYIFAIRLEPFSKLMLNNDISEQICIINFSLIRKFKGKKTKPRTVAPFSGCLKYCSISAHKYNEQFPADDIISCLYMFCEFLHGTLPWRGLRGVKEIVTRKAELQEKPPIFMDNTTGNRALIDLRDLPAIFKYLEKAEPYGPELPYRMIYKILNAIAEQHAEIDEGPSELFGDYIANQKRFNDVVNQMQKSA